jgi:NAD(P)-dependent dehydrogenase (short-subunit alcohol dehydrogenase family)
MTGQVQGKVALVTGGASGIGAAVAESLAREGASVAVTDIDDLRGPEVVAGIKKAGHEAVFLHQDVTSEPRWIEVVTDVEKRFGRLDILVSNAGIGIAVPSITDMSLADWRRQTAINLDGVFLSVKHGLPLMRRTGGGSIIMMSSLAGLRGAAGLSGYSATKGGVRLFAKAVAMECASVGDGIRVNSVHPGIIDTPIWGKIPTEAAGRGQNAPIDPGERAKLAAPRRLRRRNRARRVVSGLRRIRLRHRYGTGHRRRHERGRGGAAGVRGTRACLRIRHCERSEAIQLSSPPHGLLRFARNDGGT